jgi:toxin FitB
VFLIDTIVLSEFRLLQDGRGNPNVAAWAKRHDPDTFYISAATIMEVEIGIRRMERRDAKQGRILRDWMMGAVLPRYANRILAVDQQVASLAASFHVPDPAPFADSLIAATSIIHQLTIVTRSFRDFGFPGVNVLNPWDA